MALPPPPKYKRLIEEQDSKHVERQRAKKAEARARAIRRMKEWEAEQKRKQEQKRRSSAISDNSPTIGVGYTISITDSTGTTIYQS